jgi:hypothetical protein
VRRRRWRRVLGCGPDGHEPTAKSSRAAIPDVWNGPGSFGAPALIILLAALGRLFGAAFALRPLRVARDLEWCDHEYPRWVGHTTESMQQLPPCSAHRLLSWAGAPWLTGLRPFACPGPMLQGVSYVQVGVVYIRNIIPIRAPAGLSRVQSKPLPGRARVSHPPARPDLFTPNVGEEKFCEVRCSKVAGATTTFGRRGGAEQGFESHFASACRIRGVDSWQALTGCCVRTS